MTQDKKIIPTNKLLNTFIKYVRNGTHRVESKSESDRKWLALFKRDSLDFLPDGFTKQDYADYIYETLDPIDHNFSYTFTGNVYEPVEFKVTKINRTYGFTRQDTGECCNFTIVKDKERGGFTFKLQPLDYFNLPEWVGG